MSNIVELEIEDNKAYIFKTSQGTFVLISKAFDTPEGRIEDGISFYTKDQTPISIRPSLPHSVRIKQEDEN